MQARYTLIQRRGGRSVRSPQKERGEHDKYDDNKDGDECEQQNSTRTRWINERLCLSLSWKVESVERKREGGEEKRDARGCYG